MQGELRDTITLPAETYNLKNTTVDFFEIKDHFKM